MFEQILRKTIATMVKEKVCKLKGDNYKAKKDFERFRLPQQQWTHRDYELLSVLMGVSCSTVKRLYACRGYQQHRFSHHTRSQISDFLGYEQWQELENQVLLKFIRKALD